MHARTIDTRDGRRTLAIVLETGDEALSALTDVARRESLSAASLTAVGAFQRVVLGYFNWDSKEYERVPLDEQVEVLALTGDASLDPDGHPTVHAHVVVGRRDGTAHGGHLLEGWVRPTLEVIAQESPAHLIRRHDPVSGLSLIRDLRGA